MECEDAAPALEGLSDKMEIGLEGRSEQAQGAQSGSVQQAGNSQANPLGSAGSLALPPLPWESATLSTQQQWAALLESFVAKSPDTICNPRSAMWSLRRELDGALVEVRRLLYSLPIPRSLFDRVLSLWSAGFGVCARLCRVCVCVFDPTMVLHVNQHGVVHDAP